jgi:hypothetical protein
LTPPDAEFGGVFYLPVKKVMPMQKVAIRKHPELFALVDDEDFGTVSHHKWYLSALGYAVTPVYVAGKRRSVLLHRFVMNAPKGKELDHKNRNKLDCQKENLRYATRSENCRNRPVRSDNKFGVSGISKRAKGGYVVYWGTPPDRVWRNCKTFEEALKIRVSMAKKYYGEFSPHTVVGFPVEPNANG